MMLSLLVVHALAAAPEVSDGAPRQAEPERFAVMSPAALPSGGLAFYGIVGAPDLGAGYRQGFAPFELEARALFNYLELSFLVDAAVRVPVVRSKGLVFAPLVGLGFKANSGNRGFDRANFASFALRPRLGAVLTYEVSPTVTAIGQLEVPWALSVNVNGHQVTPTLGAGLEFAVGSRLSVLLLGQLGVDAIKEPLGVTQVRMAWAARLGLGYRLF